jgi:hypothetical protein
MYIPDIILSNVLLSPLIYFHPPFSTFSTFVPLLAIGLFNSRPGRLLRSCSRSEIKNARITSSFLIHVWSPGGSFLPFSPLYLSLPLRLIGSYSSFYPSVLGCTITYIIIEWDWSGQSLSWYSLFKRQSNLFNSCIFTTLFRQ